MKKIRNLLLALLLVLGLAVQVCAVDGETGVPEEKIVYKQDKLYVFVAPDWGVEELYCNVQYGVDNSYATSRMTPVEGKENVWVIENLPEEITGIGPVYYDGDMPVCPGTYEIGEAGENDNMCLFYSTGFSEWSTYDPDAHYEDNVDYVPDEGVDPDENIGETIPPETIPPETLPDGVQDMGSCGEKATYTLYDDGLLVIEGEGAVRDCAFLDRKDIIKVEIRDGITHIGEDAFYMSSVVDVVMADSVTSMGNETRGNIFSYCTNLQSIKLSENLTKIPSSTFYGCSSLKEIVIPDSVTSLADYAFNEATGLENVTIGSGVTSINGTTFSCCENLSELILSEGLERIDGQFAFYGTKLKSLVIPDSVTFIGEGAFSNIAELESVTLGKNLTELSTDLFSGCTGLKEVVIPEGVQSIGYGAFYECTSLQEIKFPDTVTTIEAAAFFGCSSLEEVVIPDSVTSLNGGKPLGTAGLGAFDGCTNLKSITIGKGVELLPWGFLGSESLETLILPENVTQIDAYAISTNPSLTYVEIQGELESVENHALGSNTSLTNIVFRGNAPKNVETMMGICGNDISATFYPKDNPTWKDVWVGTEEMIPYTLDEEGNIIPEAPEKSEILAAMERFRSGEYFNYVRDLSAGTAYLNNYRYYINGNFHEGKGSEAFAFELSDACFGFLPISDHRDVVYADLRLGDLLYMANQVWVIGDINAEGVKVHGAENEVIVYDKALTKAQVEAADSYRTRYGISPGPGVTNPYLTQEKITVPEGIPTEEEAYQRIIALKEAYPEGMPWNGKNFYYLNVEATWTEDIWCDGVLSEDVPLSIERNGSACSAFGYLASDTAFGDLPAAYITYDNADYDNIMVGDNLLGFGHQVVVLEVYKDCLVVVEGNYNGIIHWGRILPREEVEGYYDVLTRYPEGTVAPERGYYEIPKEPEETVPMDNPFMDIGEEKAEKPFYFEPVLWAVNKGITTGTSETTFAPDSECTRGQIVTFIWRAKGEPEPRSTSNPFTDVKSTDYFYKAVLWAVEQGITNGLSDTTFGPNKGCTRGQVCTFLWRAQGQPAPQNATSPFSDVTGDYYYNAVLWAVEYGITNGVGDGKFAPNSVCTRGQIVTFLYRSLA